MLAKYPVALMSPAIVVLLSQTKDTEHEAPVQVISPLTIVVLLSLDKDTEHEAPVHEISPLDVNSTCIGAVTLTAALEALEDSLPDTSTLARKLDNTIVLPVHTRYPVPATLRFSPALTDSVEETVFPSNTTSPSMLICMLHPVHVSAQAVPTVNADCVEFSAVALTGHALSELSSLILVVPVMSPVIVA